MTRRPLVLGKMLAALSCAASLLSPPLAHADTCTGLSLSPLLPGAGVGTTPNAVAVGDFNRDGRMDVAVANGGSNNVTILLGDGSGGLTTGSTVPLLASNAVDIATGDLDRDGILDLVVAFGSSPQAQLIPGLSSGGFSTGGLFSLGDTPTRIYLANFTADADLDLVVVYEAGQRLRVFGGATGVAFGGSPLTDISLTGGVGERPAAAAVLLSLIHI